MQDPLKTNKAFKEAYLSYHAHKRYLTPLNVDNLVSSLHQIKLQQDTHQESSLFVDSYLQQTLPVLNDVPLIGQKLQEKQVEGKYYGKLTPLQQQLQTVQTSSDLRQPLSLNCTKLDCSCIKPLDSITSTSTSISTSTSTRRFRRQLSRSRMKISTTAPPSYECKRELTRLTSLTGLVSRTGRGEESDIELSLEDEEGSGWQEEEELLSDIEDESQISDITSSAGLESCWESEDIISPATDDLISPPPVKPTSSDFVKRTSTTEGATSAPMIPPRLTYPGEREGGISPSLTPSLFPGRPSTLHFPLPDESYEPLPAHYKSKLKWKPSTVTPNIVKHVISRVGFTFSNKDWIGYWGKHMKSEAFRLIQEHQKVNHFPGSFQLGRKDRLWRNLSRMQAHYGRKDFDFIPQTFVLPNDMRQFKQVWEERRKQKWIIKPPASARGIGIRVVHKWSQIPKKKPLIVQRYLSEPFLINGSKFDLRIYVYVTSLDPLKIYVYRDGLVRFATRKYSQSTKTLSNRFVHLTNYSVNKKNSEFLANSDETQCYGHKWGLLALWEYMETQMKIDPRPVWVGIQDVVIKTILSCEGYIASLVKANLKDSGSVHELFGFDIMLDKHLKPWLLEVNISPSLHSNSRLDFNIKGYMIRDLFNIAGFYLPTKDTEQIIDSMSSTRIANLSSTERLKHSRYTRYKTLSEAERSKILDELTPDDCCILMNFIDEISRRGGFILVYPTLGTYEHYSHFFEKERYYNILLQQWIKKYNKKPDLGESFRHVDVS